MAKILISGGTGTLGRNLTQAFEQCGHTVFSLSRAKKGDRRTYYWDPEKGYADPECLHDTKIIINLAGSTVARPWTKKSRKDILNSRVLTTRTLVNLLRTHPHEVQLFIQASAIGYYGPSLLDPANEKTDAGKGFLAEVCQEWEAVSLKDLPIEIRHCVVRIGVVLSTRGGFLQRMLPFAKLGLAANPGKKSNWVSWIHIDDLSRIFLHLTENENLKGIFNAVSPAPTTSHKLIQSICSVLNRPYWLPSLPSFILRFVLGEMATMLTSSQPVSSKKLTDTGFVFRFDDPEPAIRDLLKEDK